MKSKGMALIGTMLSLIGLYLVLVYAAGASQILGAFGEGGAKLAKVLQGRG